MGPWELHPALVHFPIAFLVGGVAVDLVAAARERPDLARTASGLLGAGVATGLLAGAAGGLAFFTVPGMHADWAHRAILWHLGLATTGLGVMTAAVLGRRGAAAARPSRAARVAGVLGLAFLGTASYLGGEAVYHAGMGVDPDVVIRPTPSAP